MPKKRAFARISITLPPGALAAADRVARALDRSRSWVIAEAVRQYAEAAPGSLPASDVVREAAPAAYAVEAFEAARLARLKADLDLTPTERLRSAEELVRLARVVRPRPRRAQVLGFESLEDFATWKKARRVEG